YFQFDALQGLLDSAPYETIRRAIDEYELPPKTQIVLRGLSVPLNPVELLYVTSNQKNDRNNRHAPPIEPQLLLTIIADLTGASESQDERIAIFFSDTYNRVALRSHLETVLVSPLVAGQHARRMLANVAAKSKSPQLVDAIR